MATSYHSGQKTSNLVIPSAARNLAEIVARCRAPLGMTPTASAPAGIRAGRGGRRFVPVLWLPHCFTKRSMMAALPLEHSAVMSILYDPTATAPLPVCTVSAKISFGSVTVYVLSAASVRLSFETQ